MWNKLSSSCFSSSVAQHNKAILVQSSLVCFYLHFGVVLNCVSILGVSYVILSTLVTVAILWGKYSLALWQRKLTSNCFC